MTEYVPVSVPAAIYPDVLRLILDRLPTDQPEAAGLPTAGEEDARELAGDAGAASVRGPIKKVRAGFEWTAEDFERLIAADYRATKVMGRAMDALSERPGVERPMADLCTAIGEEPEALRTSLGAFTRHVRAHFPGHRWPFSWQRIGGIYRYGMHPETAARWRKIRGL